MSFLLDTNVVSEWAKMRPNAGVVAWLSDADEDRVFLSVITLAELGHGVERLALGRLRKRLDEWLRHELTLRFEGRILLVDASVADAWGSRGVGSRSRWTSNWSHGCVHSGNLEGSCVDAGNSKRR